MAGIYLHIPFCRKACHYCNFHFSTGLEAKERMVASIKKEIAHVDAFISSEEIIETIYFGGGTPSLLNESELNVLLEQIYKRFHVAPDCEITIEANPDDIDYNKVKSWIQSGINRISLGIQSFHDDELRWMNRSHNAAQSIRSIDLLHEGGLKNISADLIFGSPLSNDWLLDKNVQLLIEKQIPHLSCYALTVEEKTALHHHVKTKMSPAPNNELQARHFEMLHHLLTDAGYEHYEISNYARVGFRSRHNSNYWKGIPYHGFGPSAHGFDGKQTRRWNISNNALYVGQWEKGHAAYEHETLSVSDQHNEAIMTALRTIEGIGLDAFTVKFGEASTNQLMQHAAAFISDGKMRHDNNRLFLTVKGMLYADGIAASLFELS